MSKKIKISGVEYKKVSEEVLTPKEMLKGMNRQRDIYGLPRIKIRKELDPDEKMKQQILRDKIEFNIKSLLVESGFNLNIESDIDIIMDYIFDYLERPNH